MGEPPASRLCHAFINFALGDMNPKLFMRILADFRAQPREEIFKKKGLSRYNKGKGK